MKRKLAIMASGNGTNAENIIRYFQGHPLAEVALVISSSAKAGVNGIANRHNIPLYILQKETYTGQLAGILQSAGIDLIVLAGFLWLIPGDVIRIYNGRIVNIHPSLLPKFGGKGMYGNRVHEAVISGKEKESGITIHLVNENYDEGEPLLQERCPVEPGDDSQSLAARIRLLEHKHYPAAIEKLIKSI